MKWKQFFTPVTSIDWSEADRLVESNPGGEVVFLDVRQPTEYEAAHFPGAKLIPVGDLEKRMNELDRKKHFVIY